VPSRRDSHGFCTLRSSFRTTTCQRECKAATRAARESSGALQESFKRAFLDNLFYIQGKFPALATKMDYYLALAYTVRSRLLDRWISTAAIYTAQGSRTVAYLSAEF